jgi:hypothetical protein
MKLPIPPSILLPITRIVVVTVVSLLAIFIPPIIPEKDRFVFTIAVLALIICLLIEIIIEIKEKTVTDQTIQKIKEESRQQLLLLAGNQMSSALYSSPIFKNIIGQVSNQTIEIFKELAQGSLEVSDEYLNIANLFFQGRSAIEKSILAIEAGSNPNKWLERDEFKNYHAATVAAVDRGVKFERIWVIDQGSKESYLKIWQLHKDRIKTRYIYKQELANLKLYDLDFAIIDDEILFVSNILIEDGNKKYKGGRISVNTNDVAKYQQKFQLIRNNSSDAEKDIEEYEKEHPSAKNE